MAVNPNLGGLDLSALAAQAAGETDTRIAGGQAQLGSALASMLQEQRGMFAGQSEAQDRDNTFQRAQAMLAEALAQREQAMQAADALARARAEGGGGGGGQPNWYEQQIFQTDENIRQAKALRALDLEDQAAAAQAERPRLSDFGRDAINPYRGQALLDSQRSKGTKGQSFIGNTLDGAITRQVLEQFGPEGPFAVTSALQRIYAGKPQGDERASIALYNLGYMPE